MRQAALGRSGRVWALAALLTTAAAQTTSERLEQLQQQLQQQQQLSARQAQQLQNLRANIASLSAQQKQTLARLETLAASVGVLEQQVATLTARVALAERALADTTSQLAVTQTRVERLRGDVREILATQYRDRSGRYLQLLSQSTSLSDLLIRVKYANLAGQYNVKVIETLRGEVQVLRTQQAQQTQQAQAVKTAQAQRTAALTRLQTQRQQQTALLAQLRQTEAGQRTLAARRQAEQALTTGTINSLFTQVVTERARIEAERQRRLAEERRRREEEARRIREAQERARLEAIRLARVRAEQERRRVAASQLAAQRQREQQLQQERSALQARQNQVQAEQQEAEIQLAPLPQTGGSLAFPLPGGRVAAPYGREGAVWVVLGGADASTATAARAGNVLAASLYGTLGYVIIVDHGSLLTAYMGLREPTVSVGDRVQQGTPLGSIGGSPVFGPGRMGFSVKRGDAYVNPGF
ncbi:murein hydrolase activator EnvC family protein [Deinococcus yunweiensis]|uniref:murein hydrolase activator EnvC family protein n=1 Tax=Deinococcus yunweiensis TaxID=367282 RepID=UPI00398ED8D2